MGMYTHLVLNANLRKDTPNDILGMLMYLSYQTDICPISEDHDLYDIMKYRVVMRGDSRCFDGKSHFEFLYDNIQEEWMLTINSNIKNYDKEYERFLNCIHPYITEDILFEKKFLGFIHYEENENPKLIYNTKAGIEFVEI